MQIPHTSKNSVRSNSHTLSLQGWSCKLEEVAQLQVSHPIKMSNPVYRFGLALYQHGYRQHTMFHVVEPIKADLAVFTSEVQLTPINRVAAFRSHAVPQEMDGS